METAEIDLHGLFGLLRRQRRLVAAVVVAVLVVAAAIAYMLPPVYSASALILVDPSHKNLLDPETRPASSGADSARIDSEVELARSDNVLLHLIERENLLADPEFGVSAGPVARLLGFMGLASAAPPAGAEALERSLSRLRQATTVQRRGLTYLLSIQVRSATPETAARLANAMAETYISSQLAAKVDATVAALTVLQARLERARAAVTRSEARYDRFLADTGEDAPPDADILTQRYELQQGAELARRQYQTLLARAQDFETQIDLQLADSRIVSPALVPLRPASPNKPLLLTLALLAGLALGVALAFLYENLIGGVTSQEQLAAALKIPVAATIPRDEERSGEGSAADLIVETPLSDFAESIRRTRAALDQTLLGGTRLSQPATTPLGRVVMVCSTNPEEGKTTLALALARAYALSGRTTLLVDGDLRAPALHTHLRREATAGLLDILHGETAATEPAGVLMADPLTPLTVLPGGRHSDMPTDQLLANPNFALFIAAARRRFDYVILDTPAVGPVVDALYTAPFADAVLFVVKWAATAQREAKRALDALSRSTAPDTLLLAVMTQAQGNRS